MKKIVYLLIIVILLVWIGLSLFKISNEGQPEISAIKVSKQENFLKEIKIIFVGDIMLDRHIRKMMAIHGEDQPFICFDSLLQSADLVVGNLEGPITNNKSISLGSIVDTPENYVFTFSTSTANLLYKHNIRLVNLGNNHISNFSDSGIKQTKFYLEQARVNYFGGLAGDNRVFKTTINGTNLSFINYNQFGGDSIDSVTNLIRQEKSIGNTVIVYTHWGEEYIEATQKTRNIAKIFAEAGADLIVGTHPHVIQESEVIDKTIVYYSLGNFIFDQYFRPEVKTGLILIVTFKGSQFKVEEQKVTLNKDGQTCLLY